MRKTEKWGKNEKKTEKWGKNEKKTEKWEKTGKNESVQKERKCITAELKIRIFKEISIEKKLG